MQIRLSVHWKNNLIFGEAKQQRVPHDVLCWIKALTLSVPEPVTVKNRPSSATKPTCALMSGKPLSPWSPCNHWMPLLGYKNSTYVSCSPHMIAACRCFFAYVMHNWVRIFLNYLVYLDKMKFKLLMIRFHFDSIPKFKFMRSDCKLPEMYSDGCYFHDNVRHFPTWQQLRWAHGNYHQRRNFDEPHRKPAVYSVRLAAVTMKSMFLAQHLLCPRSNRMVQSMDIPMGMAHLKSHSIQYQTLKCPACWSKCWNGQCFNDDIVKCKHQRIINFTPNTQAKISQILFVNNLK